MGRKVKRKTTRPRKLAVHVPQKEEVEYKAPKKEKASGSRLECPQCGKTFAQLSSLSRHKRTHTGQKTHVCKTCGKAFYQRNNLIQHASVHISKKRFDCDTCGKSFSQLSSLSRHKRTHMEGSEEDHVCFQCGKSFNQKANLDQHVKLHKTPSSKLECLDCGKKFKQLSSLSRHKKTHQKFTCTQCGAKFAERDNLYLHEAAVHSKQSLIFGQSLLEEQLQIDNEDCLSLTDDSSADDDDRVAPSMIQTKTVRMGDDLSDHDSDDDILAIDLDNDDDDEERSYYSDSSFSQPIEVEDHVEVNTEEISSDYDGWTNTNCLP